eukprot:c22798_g1_i1 orf=199-1044(+)
MEFFPSGSSKHAPGLQATTLILPSLCIGNVGQLAVDLLISSLQVEKVGFLDDPHVLPCVGNDPFGPEANGELTVALEVFEDPDHNLRIVQQRSPVVKGAMLKFAKNLALWAYNSGIKEVVILSGLDSGKASRHAIERPQIHYISSTNDDGTDEECIHLGWRNLEQFSPSDDAWKQLESLSLKERVEDGEPFQVPLSDEAYFPGMPFASLFSCCKAQGMKVTCILCFCSEGDNVPDAFFLAEAVSNMLHLPYRGTYGERLSKWVAPLSWGTVYGPPPDQCIF